MRRPDDSAATVLRDRAAAGEAATATAPLQLLRFSLGAERCAVRIESVREIIDLPRTTPLPLMPAFVHGVMNLRGAVVPVIDLGARLGLASFTMSRTACVVVVDVPCADAPDLRIGMLVDAVHEVFDVEASTLEAVPRLGTRIDPQFIRAIARAQGQTVSDIDLETVFDHQVLSRLIASHHMVH